MWEQIRSNQIRSAILIVGMGAVWLLLGFVFGLIASYITHIDRFESGIYGIISAAVLWVCIILVAYFYGDRIIVALSGAKQIISTDLRRLYNVIDEMKIASGLEVMPSVYVIGDQALNAFAIGRDSTKSAIVVTSGLLSKLNRDELQGVVGHEIAHIKNRDVLLMSLCATLLGTMNILTWIFSPKRLLRMLPFLLRIASLIFVLLYAFLIVLTALGIQINTWSLMTIFLAIPAFMLLMPFIAKLIYFAISRRREYLADASSVLYTRYPEGLASALEKIAHSTYQLKTANQATAPIYIINPFRKQGSVTENLTSTHPPISERIRILRAISHISYADYDRAYREICNVDKGIIPDNVVAATGVLPMRKAIPDDLDQIQRTRETSNVLWNLNNYKIVSCPCGTKMRVPPKFKYPQAKCPHCGKMNPV